MKVCATPGCPELTSGTYCAAHKPAPWAGSKRSSRVKGRESEKRENKRVMRLHRGICHVCGRPGSDEVDHIVPLAEGGTDDVSNKAPIHGRPCHMAKTQREAARARRRTRAEGR